MTRIPTRESQSGWPTCTVVICTRNRPQQLDACVTAVLAQSYPKFDVLIVDNASRDSRSIEIAARHGVRCVEEARVGASYARNRGAAEAGAAEVLAYIDDDAEPEDGWLEGLIAEFKDRRVMCVVGRILPIDVNTEGSRMCIALGILDGGIRRFEVDNDSPDWFAAMRGGLGGAANMALRRAVFHEWPGFDPRLGRGSDLGGGEEDYAYLSFIKRGYRVVYAPNAIARHPFPATIPELRANHLHTLKTSTAVLAFMFVEEPGLRAAILRHALLRMPRRQRRSFQRAPVEARRLSSAWREALAALRGVAVFVLSVRGRRKVQARPIPADAASPNPVGAPTATRAGGRIDS